MFYIKKNTITQATLLFYFKDFIYNEIYKKSNLGCLVISVRLKEKQSNEGCELEIVQYCIVDTIARGERIIKRRPPVCSLT